MAGVSHVTDDPGTERVPAQDIHSGDVVEVIDGSGYWVSVQRVTRREAIHQYRILGTALTGDIKGSAQDFSVLDDELVHRIRSRFTLVRRWMSRFGSVAPMSIEASKA